MGDSLVHKGKAAFKKKQRDTVEGERTDSDSTTPYTFELTKLRLRSGVRIKSRKQWLRLWKFHSSASPFELTSRASLKEGAYVTSLVAKQKERKLLSPGNRFNNFHFRGYFSCLHFRG